MEILNQLLESEVLNEDTVNELREAINQQLDEAKQEAAKEAEEKVRHELVERWVDERDALIEAVDNQVSDLLKEEINELKSDIDQFRDLEVEYAEKLTEERAKMKEQLTKDMDELVEHINTFLEMRLTAEVDELKEDIEEVRKLEFGREIFEGFINEYRKNFVDEESLEGELTEARRENQELKEQIEQQQKEQQLQEHSEKVRELTQNLQGRQREVMENILHHVPTDELEEGFNTFIGKVLRENTEESEEKESGVLAEDSSGEQKSKEKEEIQKELKESGYTVTGDTEPTVILQEDDDENDSEFQENLKALRKIGGLEQ